VALVLVPASSAAAVATTSLGAAAPLKPLPAASDLDTLRLRRHSGVSDVINEYTHRMTRMGFSAPNGVFGTYR
jgi:hypothetical protein